MITPEDAIEAKAFIDLHRVSARQLIDDEQFECMPLGKGCAISLPAAPAMGLNRILGLTTTEDLDHAYSWMMGRNGKRFLQLNDNTASGDVKTWLQSKALVAQQPGWAKLTRNAGAFAMAPSPDIRTRTVGRDEAEFFGTMMCRGFGFPDRLWSLWAAIVGQENWACFFALDRQEPVGTGAMYVSGEYAWLGGGTTLPAFRNRGVQKALIQARIDAGATRGVSTFVVETQVPSSHQLNVSYENLRKMGFQHIYNRNNYLI